jgi:hypothetical protein
MLDVTGTERGTFEAGRVRIVASRRLSSRAGAERRVSPERQAIQCRADEQGACWD